MICSKFALLNLLLFILSLSSCLHNENEFERVCIGKIKNDIRKSFNKESVKFKVIGTIPTVRIFVPLKDIVSFFDIDTLKNKKWEYIISNDFLGIKLGKVKTKKSHNYYGYAHSDNGTTYDYTFSYYKINKNLFFVSLFKYKPDVFNAIDAGEEWLYLYGFDKKQNIVFKRENRYVY